MEPCMHCGGTESDDDNPLYGVKGGRIHKACVNAFDPTSEVAVLLREKRAGADVTHIAIGQTAKSFFCVLCSHRTIPNRPVLVVAHGEGWWNDSIICLSCTALLWKSLGSLDGTELR